MTAPDWMRLALMDFDTEPKVFCDDRRFNQWGRQVTSCTIDSRIVHEDHVDVHAGRTWRNA